MTLPLPSSARTKRRYLRVVGSRDQIEHALMTHLGTLGWSRAAPLFITVRRIRETVVSIDRASLDAVRAALELSPEKLKVVRVSGTIEGLR